MNPSIPKGEFHIAFDTNSTPGYLSAVKVTIEVDLLPADDTEYCVALADHPLYKLLQQYVRGNPR